MGSFYMRDAITNSIIQDYDEVVMFLVEDNQNRSDLNINHASSSFYPHHRFNFASLPIHGDYADYGRVEANKSLAVHLALKLTDSKSLEDMFDKLSAGPIVTEEDDIGFEDGKMVKIKVAKKRHYGVMMIAKNTYEDLKGNSRFLNDEIRIYKDYVSRYSELFEKKGQLSKEDYSLEVNKKMIDEMDDIARILKLTNDVLISDEVDIKKLPTFFRSLSSSDYSIQLSRLVKDMLFKDGLLYGRKNKKDENLNEGLHALNEMGLFSRALVNYSLLIQPSAYGGQQVEDINELKFKLSNVEHQLNKKLKDLFDYSDEKEVMEVLDFLQRINTESSKMINKVVLESIKKDMPNVVEKHTAYVEKELLDKDLSSVKSPKPKVKKA